MRAIRDPGVNVVIQRYQTCITFAKKLSNFCSQILGIDTRQTGCLDHDDDQAVGQTILKTVLVVRNVLPLERTIVVDVIAGTLAVVVMPVDLPWETANVPWTTG